MTLFRPLDIIIILLVAAGSVGAAVSFTTQPAMRAEIYVNGEKRAGFSLNDQSAERDIPTDIGPVRIQYGDGGIRVASSPCPQQICIRRGTVRHAGKSIVCLPAKLEINIVGKQRQTDRSRQVDAVSY